MTQIKMISVAVLAAGFLALITACTMDGVPHVHTFNTEWTSDKINHWHAATCEHTDEVSEKAEHTFGEWKSNNNATTEADGTKTRTCSACGYAETVTDAGTKTVKTPTFSAAAGAVAKGTNVTITCATEGAKIYYTTDGTKPTATSPEYADAINITVAVTVKAIAVKDGLKDSAVAIANYEINVNDFSKCIVGDFILKDRTILSKDSTPESGTVAAVIARAAENGKPALGVGIVHNKEGLEWCISGASGSGRSVTPLLVDEDTGTIGYVDGSNSWDLLVANCNDLKNATANTIETVAEKYPAFNFCRKYGTVNNLSGDLANGWYLPTVAELGTIFWNLSTVDASLLKAGGNQFDGKDYMSCCQSPDHAGNTICFYNYGFMLISKNTPVNVCAVRAFN